MKRLFLILALIAFSGSCAAEKITLVCKGWSPVYERFDSWPLNKPSDQESFVIDLDTKALVAKYTLQIGEVKTNFQEKDGYYWGSTDIDKETLGKALRSVNFSINRLTGETYISYAFQNEKDGKVGFSGTCAPGKPLF